MLSKTISQFKVMGQSLSQEENKNSVTACVVDYGWKADLNLKL